MLKRKHAAAAIQEQVTKKLKSVPVDAMSDDGDQGISDDGVAAADLGRANFDDSGTSGSSEEESDDEDEKGGDEEGELEAGFEDLEAEEDWQGLSGDTNGLPRSQLFDSKLFRAPTTQEIRSIKEASELYQSHSFKLQVDALLPTVIPKQSHVAPLDKCLFELHALISSIPPHAEEHPLRAAAKLQKKGVVVPYPSPPPTEDAKFKVSFAKPKSDDIKVVGSWANKLSVLAKDKSGFGVDLVLQMPSTIFHEKDYLNARFFHKRAFYLAVVAQAVMESTLGLDVSYVSPQADVRRTHLVLKPRPTKSPTDFTKSKAVIRIHLSLSIDDSPISIPRLSPSHSNLRVASDGPAEYNPTPIYNNLLAQSLTPTAHLLSVFEYKNNITSFSQALTLLRAWANQRGYSSHGKQIVAGFEGVGGDWWSFVLGYLVFGSRAVDGIKTPSRKPLGKGLSSYQLFRGALDFLSKHDFDRDPVFARGETEPKFPLSEYAAHHEASFIDPTGIYNFLSGVPSESLELLRHDARCTLDALNNSSDGFEWSFMKDLRDMSSRFDAVLRVHVQVANPRKQSSWDVLEHGTRTNATIYFMSQTIRRALSNRASNTAIILPSTPARPVTEAAPTSPTYVDIGIVYNPTEAGRLVDHGPPAGDEAAGAEFRAFWGSKAELRRFKDGSIQESVVWDGSTPEDKAQIPLQIVRHILDHHFGLKSDAIRTYHAPIVRVLTTPKEVVAKHPLVAKASFRSVTAAFDELTKAIKAIDEEELPLSLSHVAPASEALRSCSVFAPLPVDILRHHETPSCATYVAPMDIIIVYEHSPKWPEDLAAIQKLKLALLEVLARQLEKQNAVTFANVVFDEDGAVIENNCALEVITPSGFAFRAKIYCELEKALLQRFARGKSKEWKIDIQYPVSKDDARKALAAHTRSFESAPQHHNAVSSLLNRCPSYGTTVRLVKRWLSVHLLATQMSLEIIELICAYVYLCPGALSIPSTGPAGFARVVRLLMEWDYRETPLLVPIYSSAGLDVSKAVVFPLEKRAEAEKHFADRLGDSGWFIATEQDTNGTAFGAVSGPSGMIPARVKQVAGATWKCLYEGMASGHLDISAMFTHPLDDYDFTIHLNPRMLTRYYQNAHFDATAVPDLKPKHKMGLQTLEEVGEDAPRVDFDPGLLLYNDLRRIYADTALFFYDTCGGAIVGGAWNPRIRKAREFKVLAGYSSCPMDNLDPKNAQVRLNDQAVLNEIERLGASLIEKIVIAS